jgi:hypothetical protein
MRQRVKLDEGEYERRVMGKWEREWEEDWPRIQLGAVPWWVKEGWRIGRYPPPSKGKILNK